MVEELVLRELKSVEEVPDLLDTWRSSVERRGDFLSAADLDAVATALEAIYSQSLRIKIAEQHQRIVGFAAWSEQQIELLWVRHSERRKRVGRSLLDEVISTSPGVSIHLDGKRQHAIEFFEDCGFRQLAGGLEEFPQRVVLRHGQIPAMERGTIGP